MPYGIKIADKDMGTQPLAYTTENNHVQVDLKPNNPPFLGVITVKPQTEFTGGTVQEEVIFSMNHNLPYTPKVYCYFYVVDAPATFSDKIGNYFPDRMLMSSTGPYTDLVFSYVDDKVFQIKHGFKDKFSAKPSTNPSTGWTFRVKYMITNLDRRFPTRQTYA